MNVGKTLFAQVMEFVPWTSFTRIVERYSGNARVRRMTCAEQFRAMAFAQLTWRESLRDIEACLSANASKLYGMGFRSPVKRSTLADANESRDWRIWSDLRPAADPPRPQAVRNEDPRCGSGQHGLRAGLHDDRSVPEPVRLGAVSLDQGGHQAAHAAGSARRHPDLHPHQRRQAARRQRAGHAAHRGRRLLRDGSRLSGFRPAVRVASGRRLLRHARQVAAWTPGACTRRRPTAPPA